VQKHTFGMQLCLAWCCDLGSDCAGAHSFCADAHDGKTIYKLQKTTDPNECVLAREIGSPLAVTIEVTSHADTATIVGSMNGVICATKTYAREDQVRACDFSPLVASGLLLSDRMTRQQRVSLQMMDGRVVAGGQVLKEGIGARARRTRNQPPSGDGVKKSFLK
jgi:hypothetical protein